MAYSQVPDLLIGDTRIDGVVNPQKMIDSAADEIDGMIGNIYKTPIELAHPTTVDRPTALFLKTINNHLATGRILLTISRTAEHNQLDALGKYYVRLALDAIQQIIKKQVILEGAALIQPDDSSQLVGPRIFNGDEGSFVDMFYGATNPANPFKSLFTRRGNTF